MTTESPLLESSIHSLPLVHSGKVRDIYRVGEGHLLIITTDRVSAFDVILDGGVPGKGKVLNRIANFWFNKLSTVVPNHLDSELKLGDVLTDPNELRQATGRSMLVKKLRPLPIEAIVRGYISGSGWKSYQQNGQVCGISLPAGLQEADRLPEPIFTPSTKAAVGDHDENISFEQMIPLLGAKMAEQVRDVSLEIYNTAVEYALKRGIIIADTKFEFGLDDAGRLHLIDEVLTPDSSRFWPLATYRPGTNPPSFDKQVIRDYLETLDWDKKAPAPALPDTIVKNAAARYREVADLLCGQK